MALYNKVRPMTFKDVLGQEKAVRILKDGLEKKKEDYPQVNIFIGPHGTGKTTCARILAKVLNCENVVNGEPCCECDSCRAIQAQTSPSVYELDAASNNGVDDARAIIEQSKFVPVGKKKVFILDEVQMLSTQAWNAFLKIFEEPPKDVFFILCTTESLKVTATAKSRCQEVVFNGIDQEVIKDHLCDLCEKEGIQIAPDALELIARNAGGHMRDAISSLEKYSVYDFISTELILEDTGESSEEIVKTILKAVFEGNCKAALDTLTGENRKGKSTKRMVASMMEMLTALISVLHGVSFADRGKEYASYVTELSLVAGKATAVHVLDSLIEAYPVFNVPQTSFYLEAVLTKIVSEESLLCEMEREIKELKERPVSVVSLTDALNESADNVVSFDEGRKLIEEEKGESPAFTIKEDELDTLSEEFDRICAGEGNAEMPDRKEEEVITSNLSTLPEKPVQKNVSDHPLNPVHETVSGSDQDSGTQKEPVAEDACEKSSCDTAGGESVTETPDKTAFDSCALEEMESVYPDMREIEALFQSEPPLSDEGLHEADTDVSAPVAEKNPASEAVSSKQEEVPDMGEKLKEEEACTEPIRGKLLSYEEMMSQADGCMDMGSTEPSQTAQKGEESAVDKEEESFSMDDFSFFMAGGLARG